MLQDAKLTPADYRGGVIGDDHPKDVTGDLDLDAADLQELVAAYKAIVVGHARRSPRTGP